MSRRMRAPAIGAPLTGWPPADAPLGEWFRPVSATLQPLTRPWLLAPVASSATAAPRGGVSGAARRARSAGMGRERERRARLLRAAPFADAG